MQTALSAGYCFDFTIQIKLKKACHTWQAFFVTPYPQPPQEEGKEN